jgi:8-oxo-dGTP pyrophosphatase MutT (NUDIX family)
VRFTNLVREEEGWDTISSATQWADNHVSVATEVVKTPTNRTPRPWTVVHRKAAVVIAPITDNGEFLLIRQERVPIRATIWEMPAGQIDDNVEPSQQEIEAAAARELNEETGYELARSGEMIPLGHFFSSPGLTDEHCYFFVARPVVRSASHAAEEGEGILDCRPFTGEQLARMIAQNEIRDGNTLSMCSRLAANGLFSFPTGK